MKKMVVIIGIVLITMACMNLSGEPVKIIGVNGEVNVLRFDANVTEIRLTKTIYKISKIEGLSKFRNLKKLIIEFSDLRKTDFSFFENTTGLDVLQFNFVHLKDLSFISKIPSLKAFSCSESVDINNFKIVNLDKNKKLEYFGVFLANVDDLPRIINIPESLKYIDFIDCWFKSINMSNLNLLVSHGNIYFMFNDEIESCIRKINLDINLYDNSKYDELLKQYNVY